MLRTFVLAVMLSLLLVMPLLAQDDDPVVGKAGDYTIKKSDLDRMISYYSPDKQQHLRDDPEQKVVLVRRMLEVKVIADIARKGGFDKRADVKEELEFMVNDYLSKEYLMKVVATGVTVTDEDIQQYYAVNKDKFSSPEQVRVRQIMISLPRHPTAEEKDKARIKASEILERAKKGEDFAKLAEEYSDDKHSKSKGGDLGYLRKGAKIATFEDAAFSLKPGQISELVETKYGYHIIKVEDHKDAQTKPLSEVSDKIREQLKIEFVTSKTEEFLDKAKSDAGLTIYADKIEGRMPSK